MAGASRHLAAAAVAALLLLTGCASSKEKAAADKRPESEGFAWVGEGDPSNFGSDYNFCSRMNTISGRPQGVSRTIGAHGTSRESPEAFGRMPQGATRGSYADKRQFWVCMESRGWRLVGAR